MRNKILMLFVSVFLFICSRNVKAEDKPYVEDNSFQISTTDKGLFACINMTPASLKFYKDACHYVQIYDDGRVVIVGLTLDESSKLFWDTVQRCYLDIKKKIIEDYEKERISFDSVPLSGFIPDYLNQYNVVVDKGHINNIVKNDRRPLEVEMYLNKLNYGKPKNELK